MARPTHPNSWGGAAVNWTRPQATMIPYGLYHPQPYHPAAYAAVAAVNPSVPPVTTGTIITSSASAPNPLKRPHPDSAVESAGSKDHHILWMRTYDKPLPEFLKNKCKPLYCEVCSVNLNSVIQAKMHYEGKLHEKKIRSSLQTWAKENNTIPPRKSNPPSTPNASIGGPSTPQQPRYDMQFYDPRQDLYCGPCDTSFTSHAHAQQHFSGRNHKRVMSGLAPLKAGYFNTRTGKWQRQPPQETETESSESAQQQMIEPAPPPPSITNTGNGSDLIFPPPSHAPLPPPPPPPPPPAPPGQESSPNSVINPDQSPGLGPKYYCTVCGVNATSQAQLDMHLNGRNHKMKYAKMSNIPMYDAYHHTLPQPAQVPISPCKLEMEPPQQTSKQKSSGGGSKKDYSIYRTPSGEYYCGLCDLRVNSENQFVQHIASRKHKLKESSAKGKKTKTKK